MMNQFLDKKSLQEITQIFKQHVQYQYSQKEEVADISVSQQDKINRFLNCYQQHFSDYLMMDNTYQHFDYYRILSKYIKVFNFEKGKKFKSSHYDGLYIILKGYIQEITIQEESQLQNDINKNKNSKTKMKQQEQQKMSKIVSMVMGINRLKGSSNDVSQRGSVQIMSSFNNLMEESSESKLQTENNTLNQYQGSIRTDGCSISNQNNQKLQIHGINQFNSTYTGQNYEYLPNSPEPKESRQKPYLTISTPIINLQSKVESSSDLSFQKQNLVESSELQNNKVISNNNDQKINDNKNNPSTLNIIQVSSIADLGDEIKPHSKLLEAKNKILFHANEIKQKLERLNTDGQDERLDEVHELTSKFVLHTPQKSALANNGIVFKNHHIPQAFIDKTQTDSQGETNKIQISLQKLTKENIINSQKQSQNNSNQIDQQLIYQTPPVNSNEGVPYKHSSSSISSNHLQRRPSFIMMSLQSKLASNFPEYANKPQKILQNGELINLIKISDKQKKYITSDLEDSICLYIGKKSMEKAFKEQITQLRYKTSVLEKFFHNVPSNKILKLAYHFYEKSLFKNQFVYKQGDQKPHFIYIIKSGEVQISENLNNQDQKHLNENQNQQNSQINDSTNIQSVQSLDDKQGQDELQSLCRKQLRKKDQIISASEASFSLQVVKQHKVLSSIGEEEIFGIEEIILQKKQREHFAMVSSSKAEFYVIPEDLFEQFRQTESESIQQWFKQKEQFYELQRGLLQRLQDDKNVSSSIDKKQSVKKKVKKACQYLFQEDEETFKNRLDLLHKKKIIQLKSYDQYKQYIEQNEQSTQIEQIQQNIDNHNNSKNNHNSSQIIYDKAKVQAGGNQVQDNLSQFNPQVQQKKQQALLLGKIIANSQQGQLQKQRETSNEKNISQLDKSKRKINFPLNLGQLENTDTINPYQLSDRQLSNRSYYNLISPATSVASIQNKNNEQNKLSIYNNNQSNSQSKQFIKFENKSKLSSQNEITLKNVMKSPTNATSKDSAILFPDNQQTERSVEQYRVVVSRGDHTRKIASANVNGQKTQNSEYYLKKSHLKKGDSQQFLEQDGSQISLQQISYSQQQSQQLMQQSLLGIPPSVQYLSSTNPLQSTSSLQSPNGDNLNLGRIHQMIKSNNQIVRKQLNIKGKNSFFRKPMFDELKKENLKINHKNMKKISSINLDQEKDKANDKYSERWKNTTKSMHNLQKCQEYIKSTTSLTKQTQTQITATKEITSASFNNLFTPRPYNQISHNSPQSLNNLDQNHGSIVNIHMENKRKLQKGTEPYFTRPFSRVKQNPNQNDSHTKHRTLQSAKNFKRISMFECETEPFLELQLKKQPQFTFSFIQPNQTLQFSLTDRQMFTQRTEKDI